jgi:hypothetical protein
MLACDAASASAIHSNPGLARRARVLLTAVALLLVVASCSRGRYPFQVVNDCGHQIQFRIVNDTNSDLSGLWFSVLMPGASTHGKLDTPYSEYHVEVRSQAASYKVTSNDPTIKITNLSSTVRISGQSCAL